MKISTILVQIDMGSVALPEFQRGYVWNREQVRGLMDSLYRKHPVGSLLVWETRTEAANARGDAPLSAGTAKLLLDGQQRITSLYGIVRGAPPPFFEGNAAAFTGLYFNLASEEFEFYGPVKMRDDPLWIDVTKLMQEGVGEFYDALMDVDEFREQRKLYGARLNAIEQIQSIDLHIDEVTGDDKTIDVVVDIFNRVNSGGTKLSKGDLALARICAGWPAARGEMNHLLDGWRTHGYGFRLDWLLRSVNTILTNEALFSALADVNQSQVRDGLSRAEKATNYLLNLVGGRLGLDHGRVLGAPLAFPVMARYVDSAGGAISDPRVQDRLLYWYVNAMLWGRYSSASETVMNQDLAALEHGVDGLIKVLEDSRGDLMVRPNNFAGYSRGARFYPLLYMLTRLEGSRDWFTGAKLSHLLLGRTSGLQLHHIFPKARLYEAHYERHEVNALANFTFLTQESNLIVSAREPDEYLADLHARDPGLLRSHWIPLDPDLWRIERYCDFLAARRELLADAANEMLNALRGGELATPTDLVPDVIAAPGGIDSDDEERELIETQLWLRQQRLPAGEMLFEIADEASGEVLAVLDLAWPEGLQPGLSHPVALLIDEDREVEDAANRAGFTYYTDGRSFRRYVAEEVVPAGATPV